MNGVICIYKEQGYTSFDVVAIMRKLFRTKKVGHGGTLDPMAEGVLPIFIGGATKAADFCPDTTKEYRAGMRFGVTTDTQDFTGKVLSKSEKKLEESICADLKAKFTGELLQTPPMYSAVRVNGKRLYDLARKGVEIEREPRTVNIYSLDFEKFEDNDAEILVSCSKGTYIRTLIHDMGIEAGTGAVMTSLLRTRSGMFTLRDCYKLSEVVGIKEQGGEPALEKLLMPLKTVFAGLPPIDLSEAQTRMFLNGVVLDADRVRHEEGGEVYRIMSVYGDIIGLARINEQSDLSVIQRFPPPKRDEGEPVQTAEQDGHLKDISGLKGVRFS